MSKIVLENISKRYTSALIIEPLKNIDLTVESGDFIAISGDSGIGKSTLLYVMGGLIKPTGGEIFYNNKAMINFRSREIAQFRAQTVSVIFQDFQFVQALTLRDNLLVAAMAGKRNVNKQDIEVEIDEYLDRLNLHNRRFFLPSQLSGGQKRRAMVIAGVLRNSEFILADEPTNDTDSATVDEIMKILLEQKAKGRGIVIVSHNRDIAGYADEEYTLSEGKLVKVKHKMKVVK